MTDRRVLDAKKGTTSSSRRSRRFKAAGLLLAGVVAGSLLIEPVGAHFTQNTKHLGAHAWTEFIRDRVYTRNQVNRRTYTRSQVDARTYTRDQADTRFERSGCTADMVAVGPTCIDAYEVSVWDAPTGGTQFGVTEDDYPCADHGQDCKDEIFARSVPGVTPSRFITWFQAQAALTNSGKRLPSSAEWQAAAQATPDSTACNVSTGSVANTGANTDCVSAYGAFDMVGNLWEWVADWDEAAAGCQSWPAAFGDDLTCMGRGDADADNHFPGALIRGGGFDNGTDAGPFAVHGFFRPSHVLSILGFRGAR